MIPAISKCLCFLSALTIGTRWCYLLGSPHGTQKFRCWKPKIHPQGSFQTSNSLVSPVVSEKWGINWINPPNNNFHGKMMINRWVWGHPLLGKNHMERQQGNIFGNLYKPVAKPRATSAHVILLWFKHNMCFFFIYLLNFIQLNSASLLIMFYLSDYSSDFPCFNVLLPCPPWFT